MAKDKYTIYKNVFDAFTIRNIENLRNHFHIDNLLSPILMGKESNVFLAETPDNDIVVVKIYRVHSCNFNNMYTYIRSDPRFMDIKNRRRLVILTWVEREFENLVVASKTINTPKPLALEKNIIVMESIGENKPSPQLKDKYPQDPEAFLEDILNQVKKLANAGLIHADLSEFNILNHEETPYLIDFSQATSIKDPQAINYLERDMKNVARFFAKMDITVDVDKEVEKIKKIIKKKLA